METEPNTRSYHSPLRETQAEQTRAQVLDAAIDLLVEEGPEALSQRAIARRAGVSAPTVARYLPTADDIVAGIDERISQRLGLTSVPDSPEAAFAALRTIYTGMEREERAMRAYLAAPASRTFGRRRRRAAVEAGFGPALAGLEPRDRTRVLAVLQLFTSSQTWTHLREVWGIAGEEAALTAHWAMRTLFEAALNRPPSALPLPDPKEHP